MLHELSVFDVLMLHHTEPLPHLVNLIGAYAHEGMRIFVCVCMCVCCVYTFASYLYFHHSSTHARTHTHTLTHSLTNTHTHSHTRTHTHTGKITMALEFMNRGSLGQFVESFGTFSEATIRHVSEQVLKGLHSLHSRRQVHRDIKPGV
jgi:serine/threonine protein kinase